MLDGRVLEASQVEYEPFGKTPLNRKAERCATSVEVIWLVVNTVMACCVLRACCGSLPTGRPLAPRCSRPAARPRWRRSSLRPAVPVR